MRDLRTLATAMAILALALAGEAVGEAQWQNVAGPDGSFTVEMPGAPVYFAEQSKTPQGTSYPVHQYVLDHNQGVYIAQLSLYPKGVDTSDPKAVLQRILDADEKKLNGGKWINVAWGKHQGLVAVEALGVKGETEQRSYSVALGNKIFDLLYYGPVGTGRSADADRFLYSLKIGGGAQQRALPPMGSTPLQRDRP